MDIQDKVLKISADLWNEFLKIPDNERHPDDTNDFRHHLHALQNILYTQKYKKKTFTVEIKGSDLMGIINRRPNRDDSKAI